MSMISALAAAAALSVQAPTPQAGPPQTRPEALERVTACRALTDGPARLACYDAAVGALDSAERQGEVVVLDRAQVAETRRQMFGFSLPSLPRLFGPDGGSELDSIETTLSGAARTLDDRWIFRLADGGVWRQVEAGPVRFRNRAGEPVRIRRAAFGSFLLTVGDSAAVRVRRQ
ncbi:hypothetical protein [uncultured Brevundimonas sp.]|uniref:hypothetical protein n=1 Tax=uncultured Brevundimonas sp. TaxID=213418 RepID=UPI00260CC126|nr:hypothetical protein [uncultured Brevundimonas sp.]